MIKYWHKHLSNISEQAVILNGTIHAGVHIHDDVYIGENCQIEAMVFIPNGVTIEDNVFIGPGVIFTNDPALNVKREKWKPTETRICEGAKIGAGAMIRAGVTIGKNAIVGMGSVVLHNIQANETWAGNPAHKIK